MQEIDKDEGNDEENFAVITAENLKQEAPSNVARQLAKQI